jgi:hypothetical protein
MQFQAASFHLKPRAHSGGAMFRDRRFERPFAGVVDHERDMSGAAGPDEESIPAIRLPAVVHRVQEPRDVAPEPDRPDAVLLASAKTAGEPLLGEAANAAAAFPARKPGKLNVVGSVRRLV